jgi:hypothetical protein
MVESVLVPEKTTVTEAGDGPAVDISSASSPVFLIALNITEVIEQESLDLSIWGSADGSNWGDKPLLVFPQKFYRGEHPVLLDMTPYTQVKFLRAHWQVGRWGRGETTVRFEFTVKLREVPAEVLEETTAALQGL